MVQREWKLSQPDKSAVAALREGGFSRITASILALRGFKDPKAAKSFILCNEKPHDPMLFKGMPAAAQRIFEAIDKKEKITVYGDYDADGVTATALLYTYLKDAGANVDYYIPNRESEGYGVNAAAVEKIAEGGTKVIVTVDTGISAFEECELAKKLGLCFIVTDHHDPRDSLPDAFAVVDPKQPDCRYPFKELAGVGVAYKLICAIESLKPEGSSQHALFLKYGELVCLGTVADVVPLTGENRYIVTKGLDLISANPGVGTSALLDVAGAHAGRLTATFLSFTIAPRINACGRIASAVDALELLTTQDPERARELASRLNENNRERQQIEAEILSQTIKKIDGNEALRNNPVLIISGEGWHNGVIGIVASRLVEHYGKPAVVVSFEGDVGRASCRSVPGFNIHDALLACSQYLERFGGHELAAGFTVLRQNYDALYSALIRIANSLPELPALKVRPECRLRGREISLSTAREIKQLEPFGCGNPMPLFYIPAVQITEISPVGDGHMRITFNCEGFEIHAIMFGAEKKGFDFNALDIVDLTATLGVNVYKNSETLSVVIRDIRKSACFEYYEELYRGFLDGKPFDPPTLKFRLRPDRSEFVDVYRLLVEKDGRISLQEVCKRICRRNLRFNYFKALVIVDVFAEMGLVEVNREAGSDIITYHINNEKRIDLTQSALLRRLK